MKTIKVSSLPLKDVIIDIALVLGVTYHENCTRYELRLPKTLGEGTIKGIDFDDGLGLIEYDCMFYEDTVFEFSVNNVHPLKFLFCLEGTFNHNFENESDWHSIDQYKNAIVASNGRNGHVLHFHENERTVMHSLEIGRKEFQKKMNCELKSLGDTLKTLLTDVDAKQTFYYEGFYSLQLADLFREMRTFDAMDYVKKLYMEGSSFRILTLQITQFQDDLKNDQKRTILRKSELRQLQKAVETIESKLAELPTIDEISAQVGINPKKLQLGFQELLGSSVNTFVQKRRLEKAKSLLIETDHPLADISKAIGYRSKSYLTKMFKQEYGLNPSSFRQKNKTVK